MMSTFVLVQNDAAAVSDLRAWGENQLIAAAKSGRRAPFGELCERHVKKFSVSFIGSCETAKTRKMHCKIVF